MTQQNFQFPLSYVWMTFVCCHNALKILFRNSFIIIYSEHSKINTYIRYNDCQCLY